MERKLRSLGARAGVEYGLQQVHGLRLTSGTRLYKVSRDIYEVQRHLRHAHISSSVIYTRYVEQSVRRYTDEWQRPFKDAKREAVQDVLELLALSDQVRRARWDGLDAPQ
ncbi:tyrosine-type recombinase/integrase [Deinococcus peraridilitoris]|uniref:tyrosine-type recombinase/integrase n=1 Tax=Deinococcus peraridilitoris TaxID=432329 RepID=UPI0003005AA0|nr:tyrosine-type recombinase/integrase [Deinococcus peraridilitoris]